LATGTPVLAVCEPNSPLGREVIEGGFGEVIDPGNTAKLGETLNRWGEQPGFLTALQSRSRQRAKDFCRDRILTSYEEELVRCAESVRLA
jgi:colanic acid biosynthesis glycosyl transferase WcaI